MNLYISNPSRNCPSGKIRNPKTRPEMNADTLNPAPVQSFTDKKNLFCKIYSDLYFYRLQKVNLI